MELRILFPDADIHHPGVLNATDYEEQTTLIECLQAFHDHPMDDAVVRILTYCTDHLQDLPEGEVDLWAYMGATRCGQECVTYLDGRGHRDTCAAFFESLIAKENALIARQSASNVNLAAESSNIARWKKEMAALK